MTKSPRVTKTMNPLHFEDLEPHRFEDLVRQLAYDFRDWHSIEATGRGGADQGIDIRAFEKRYIADDGAADDDDEGRRVSEGNQWVIQCKRERRLGPREVEKIVMSGPFKGHDIYGYILAAPVNFSKRAYDVFRELLRERGVAEFALWGRAELEDVLLMPKNDPILFTFFGISLLTKRRSRTAEVRARITIKNKLFRIFPKGDEFNAPVLLRRIDDTHYPWDDQVKDFVDRPRWEQFMAFDYHPNGLLVRMRRHYAYMVPEKKQFDLLEGVDLLGRPIRFDVPPDKQARELELCIRDYWEHLPNRNRAIFERDGLIFWQDILYVDSEGDETFDCPHVYVESAPETNLVSRFRDHLKIGNKDVLVADHFKRMNIVPKDLPPPAKPKLSRDKLTTVDELAFYQKDAHCHQFITLYDPDGRYDTLQLGEVVPISNRTTGRGEDQFYIEVNHRYVQTAAELRNEDSGQDILQSVERQLGRPVQDKDRVHVIECRRLSKWQIDE